ncbi:hypothetical protein [Methanosarcina sp. KYL-1]|uniref:hypothetical protein n=1 Tax=Methanosarcina sp. KYL-1 TaxID=2602068 RepID=UPI002101A194|nr:hypothetical protein [Methanosarcina sp. KYL-1]
MPDDIEIILIIWNSGMNEEGSVNPEKGIWTILIIDVYRSIDYIERPKIYGNYKI